MLLLLLAAPARSQNRGVYPLGMSATNSGVTGEPGFTYAHQLLFYARDESRDADGETISTGTNAVILAMNSLVWVGGKAVLGGARFSMSATLPLTNNTLSSDTAGAISGGGGVADSYYQPVILGWSTPRLALRAIYGFLAPTGKFTPGGSNNVGSGYWTNVVASGQTVYLTASRATALSAFQMYEFHTTQQGTGIKPGQTFNIDYSLTHTLPAGDARLQLGAVGYSQRQTTARRGPGLTADQAAARYRVNALGFSSSVAWPSRDASLGFKYFRELGNRATYQGYSTQISASVGF
jgi:hypothetical protein